VVILIVCWPVVMLLAVMADDARTNRVGRAARPLPSSAAPASTAGSPSYPLEPLPDGSFVYRGERFTAKVRPDGTVSFDPRRTKSSLHLTPPIPGRLANRYVSVDELKKMLQGFQDRLKGHLDEAERKSGGQVRPNRVLQLFTPAPAPPRVSPYRRLPNADTCFLPDGTNVCDCKDNGRGKDTVPADCQQLDSPLVAVHTTLDFNEEYLRLMGEDPLASEKAAFLSSTFDFRLLLAAQHQRQLIREASDSLNHRLQSLWTDSQRPWLEKRRLLFEIWLSCDAGSRNDGRTGVEAFIREHLPEGSPNAFTKSELETLRLRPGAQAFRPYDRQR
jgi:hypothetical protein